MSTPYLPPLDIAQPYLPEHQAFWAHCQRRELRFQRCDSCEAWRHPPAPVCPECGSAACRWDLAPQRAELFSYTVVHHPSAPALRQTVPYNVAIVAFPELGDIRVVSNVIDAAPGEMRIGMPLQLVWQDNGAGTLLPLFRKEAATA